MREVLEETAHRFRPTELVGIYRWHYAPADVTFLRFAYTGMVAGVEDRPLDREIRRAVWLAYDEVRAVQSRHRSPLVMACVDDHRAGKRYPLETIVHYAMKRPFLVLASLLLLAPAARAEQDVEICYNYGCTKRAGVHFSDEQLKRVQAEFTGVRGSRHRARGDRAGDGGDVCHRRASRRPSGRTAG